MITLSAPLHGHVRGVIAADLKLDKFSDLVQAQRPGRAWNGDYLRLRSACCSRIPTLLALVEHALTHPSHPQLPEIDEIRSGLVGAVMRRWDGSDRYEGNIRDEDGRDYLFRLRKFSQSDEFSGYSLLLAAEDDFAQNVRRLQIRGLIIALSPAAASYPRFGSSEAGCRLR